MQLKWNRSTNSRNARASQIYGSRWWGLQLSHSGIRDHFLEDWSTRLIKVCPKKGWWEHLWYHFRNQLAASPKFNFLVLKPESGDLPLPGVFRHPLQNMHLASLNFRSTSILLDTSVLHLEVDIFELNRCPAGAMWDATVVHIDMGAGKINTITSAEVSKYSDQYSYRNLYLCILLVTTPWFRLNTGNDPTSFAMLRAVHVRKIKVLLPYVSASK